MYGTVFIHLSLRLAIVRWGAWELSSRAISSDPMSIDTISCTSSCRKPYFVDLTSWSARAANDAAPRVLHPALKSSCPARSQQNLRFRNTRDGKNRLVSLHRYPRRCKERLLSCAYTTTILVHTTTTNRQPRSNRKILLIHPFHTHTHLAYPPPLSSSTHLAQPPPRLFRQLHHLVIPHILFHLQHDRHDQRRMRIALADPLG